MTTERSLATIGTGVVPVADATTARARSAAARYRMATRALIVERRTLMATGRARMVQSLLIASALACSLFMALFPLSRLANQTVVRVVLPPPTRTVILEELPEAPSVAQERPSMEQLNVAKVPDPPRVEAPEAEPTPEPPPPPRRRTDAKPLDPVAKQAGQERAREATAGLAKVTAALDQALGALSSSLKSSNTGTDQTTRRSRQRVVRSGRTDGELGSVGNGAAGSGASDLSSKVQGSLVAIGTLAPSRAEASEPSAGTPKSSGAAPGVYRTNASLLAVIQKYAAGIQYCYENELKHHVGLKGKLVVALTVAASGAVVNASVVRNTVGSERLAACALSQIRDWRFPPVPEGLTTFQAPFVFTPPN